LTRRSPDRSQRAQPADPGAAGSRPDGYVRSRCVPDDRPGANHSGSSSHRKHLRDRRRRSRRDSGVSVGTASVTLGEADGGPVGALGFYCGARPISGCGARDERALGRSGPHLGRSWVALGVAVGRRSGERDRRELEIRPAVEVEIAVAGLHRPVAGSRTTDPASRRDTCRWIHGRQKHRPIDLQGLAGAGS